MHGTAYVSVRSWVFLCYHSSGSIHGQADCLCFKGVWLFGPLFSCVKSGISLNSFYPKSVSAPPCPTLCGILISWSLIEPVYQLRRNSISVYICECKLYSGIQSMSILYLFTHLVLFNSPCYFVILEGLTHHLLGSDFWPFLHFADSPGLPVLCTYGRQREPTASPQHGVVMEGATSTCGTFPGHVICSST